MSQERIFALWCAHWPAVAAATSAINPADPIVVVHAHRVIAASPKARAQSVSIGQRRREAQRNCPTAIVVERDGAKETKLFESVVQALEEICPRVEITRPGACIFHAKGPTRYFGGEQAVADRVLHTVSHILSEQHLSTDIGVGCADSIFAAQMAARRSASLHAAVLIDPDELHDFLDSLPVRSLGNPDLATMLEHLGLTTLGLLRSIDRSDVVNRFGRDGEHAHQLSSGLDIRLANLTDPDPSLEIRIECDPPIERVEQGAFIAKSAADQLHDALSQRGAVATGVVMTALTRNGDRIERRWRQQGVLSAVAVAQRFRWQLEAWVARTGSRAERGASHIVEISLAPTQIAPDTGRQASFWGGADLASTRARRGLVRVQSLLGDDAVRVPVFVGGRAPSDMYSLVPIDAIADTSDESFPVTSVEPLPWPGRIDCPDPALVWPSPELVDVLDETHQHIQVSGRGVSSAAPKWLRLGQGQPYEIVSWAGPWMTEECWWDAERHRRRARFQVVTAQHGAYLVTLESQQWRLEATYG